MQDNVFPKKGLDVMRPPEPQEVKPAKSEYAVPRAAKNNPAPCLFDVHGKAIYSEGTIDTIDWFDSHEKPCLQPSSDLAVTGNTTIAPSSFETVAISDMVRNSPSMQPLSEARLEQLRLMGKQDAPAPGPGGPVS